MKKRTEIETEKKKHTSNNWLKWGSNNACGQIE